MKKAIAAIAAIVLSLPIISFSQLRLSLTAGPHSASVIETNSLPGWNSDTEPYYSSRTAAHFGIFVEAPLSPSSRWYLHPGILYMPKGRKYLRSYDSSRAMITDTASFTASFNTNYIEVPLNLTYKMPLGKKSRFLLSAGPYFGFFYNGKQINELRNYSSGRYSKDELQLETGKEAAKINSVDIGFNTRAGFEIGNVWLTGFFSQGMKSFYTANYDGSFKHRVIGATFSLWINRPTPPAPLDSDKDGILDKNDQCITLPGSVLTNGCPDKDADGIADASDNCPDIAGTTKYGGCPVPDTDKDGLDDEKDECRNIAGLAEFRGCPPPDRDGDGIVDSKDKCPDITGDRENDGCPAIKKELIKIEDIKKVEQVARQVNFETNSDRLSAQSFAALDELVDLMTRNTDSRMIIEGHTDNVGKKDSNLLLSQKRANAVKTYLVSKGINVMRLDAIGYGAERPISENETESGKARNRRVELKLF